MYEEKIMYRFFTPFLFRTPYFPFSGLSEYEKNRHESAMREMLQIATPDLSEGIDKGADKAQYSAYRYYQRACTRPTPFGLFAGCSVGTIGSDYSKIYLSKQKEYRRSTRLDMNYICALIQRIERSKNIREQLLYYPNSSLYPVGSNLRYVEYHYRKTRRIHQIKQIENSEYIQQVLTLAKAGALFTELAKALVNDEISMEESAEFIHELIDEQALVSELEPAVTNIQPLTSLIEKLKKLPNMESQIIDTLPEIETLLNDIDRQPIGETVDIYPLIIKDIKKTKVESEIKYLFQTDMFKPTQHATISHKILKDIQQALIFLNKATPPATQPYLTQFKESFTKRYEDREMPLLFVLDNELGIGYADKTSGDISPLVDDLAAPNRNSLPQDSQSPIQSILLQKYQPSMQKVIELTDKDVKDIETKWDDLPPTISVVCEILQDNDRGRSIFIKYAGGQSAANLLGRFCHLDEQVLNHTLAIIQKEALLNPDVIYAEIVHLPESRIGNILLRPVLRPYEIPYLAKTGIADPVHNGVLSPDDLVVSVKNNRILLRSKRLNKEIVPRMSTAHNYRGQNPMPVYHFLCDMQRQDKRSGLGLFWSDAAQQLDYLPRIVYKNCILSKARWTVRKKEMKEFVDIKDDSELLIEIKQWRERRNIPDRVVLVDGDNELYIDMNHPLSIRAWLSIVKKRPSFRLGEFLFDSTTAVVRGEEGVFTNEFIFAFYRGNL
ncbi:MAG: lantibiotic dehydratase family protein [Bacteroidales bacterium]|jgi:hypothetical protein|nr:lantibiotic dehydratase family protein [Bacteroidales bacterium]